MSAWNHLICDSCFPIFRPGQTPHKVREEFRDEKADPCCFCGRPCQTGIYVREDPIDVACKGQGPVHAE